MENTLRGQWGNRNLSDFLYQVGFDFVAQLEEIMRAEGIGRSELAERLGVSKGRVSQILNNPGNLTLKVVVQYADKLDRKVTIVTYDDDDPDRESGPIPPQVFVSCWEHNGRPGDMFSVKTSESTNTGAFEHAWDWPGAPRLNVPAGAIVQAATSHEERRQPLPQELKYAGTEAN